MQTRGEDEGDTGAKEGASFISTSTSTTILSSVSNTGSGSSSNSNATSNSTSDFNDSTNHDRREGEGEGQLQLKEDSRTSISNGVVSNSNASNPNTNTNTNTNASTNTHTNANSSNLWQGLSHLKQLLDSKLINEEEFARRKNQLVDALTGTKLVNNPPSSSLSSLQADSAVSAAAIDSNAKRKKVKKDNANLVDSTSQKRTNASSSSASSSSPSPSSSLSRALNGVNPSSQLAPTAHQSHIHADLLNINHNLYRAHGMLPSRPPPDFSTLTSERALVHKFDLETSTWSVKETRVTIESEAFARGSLRLAYHMTGLQEIELEEKQQEIDKRFALILEAQKQEHLKEEEEQRRQQRELSKNKKDGLRQRSSIGIKSPQDTVLSSTNAVTSNSPSSSSLDSLSSSSLNNTPSFTITSLISPPVATLPPRRTYVAKISIDPYEERDSYFADVIMQHYAVAYARKYNSYMPPKTIEFISAWLVELIDRPNQPLCACEVFIDGVYRKHNNNFGFVSEDERNTPQAFSHFSYEASSHSILICDIQGVDDSYTDPQIHSITGVGFGKGNLGDRGVERFCATHRCNAICRYLKLPKVNNNATVTTVTRTTTPTVVVNQHNSSNPNQKPSSLLSKNSLQQESQRKSNDYKRSKSNQPSASTSNATSTFDRGNLLEKFKNSKNDYLFSSSHPQQQYEAVDDQSQQLYDQDVENEILDNYMDADIIDQIGTMPSTTYMSFHAVDSVRINVTMMPLPARIPSMSTPLIRQSSASSVASSSSSSSASSSAALISHRQEAARGAKIYSSDEITAVKFPCCCIL